MPRGNPKTAAIQFRAEAELSEQLDVIVAQYAEQGQTFTRSQVARIILRSALGNEPKMVVAHELMQLFWRVNNKAQQQIFLIFQEKLPQLIEEAQE